MAVKNRPGSARETFGQQEAAFRRGAPGKRYIGDTANQSKRAKQAERQKVERMAEVNAAERTATELGVPAIVIIAELIQDSVRLARSLATAPFRIVAALRQPRARTV